MKPYHLGICIVFNLPSELYHFMHLSNKSIRILSSHCNFRCQSSWISNFPSGNAGLTKGSKMELTQISKRRLVPSNSLKSDWTAIWSNFGSYTVSNVLSMGKLAKSRFVMFGEMSSLDKVFKISIELDVHFDNMLDTAVVKSLKESKESSI